MKLAKALLAMLAFSSCVMSEEEFDGPRSRTLKKDSELYVLTPELAESIFSEDRVMIVYYTNDDASCQKCAKGKETLNLLAPAHGLAYPDEPNFFIVDCGKFGAFCAERMKSRSFPALDFRVNGKDSFYFGDYTSKSLEQYLKPRLQNRAESYSFDGLEKLKRQQASEQFVIAVTKSQAGTQARRHFESLMRVEISDKFIDCDDKAECLLHFESNPEASLLLLLNDRRKFISLDNVHAFKQLLAEFNDFKNPLFIPFGVEFEKKVMLDMHPTLILITDDEAEQTLEAVGVFRQQAEAHRNMLFAAHIEKSKLTPKAQSLYNKFIEEVGVEDSALPLVIMVEPDMETMKLNKYIFSMSPVSAAGLKNYISAWQNRKLEPSLKSESRPPSHVEGIEVITYSTFNKKVHVKDQESVVLVHNGIDKCPKSKASLKIMKTASNEDRFRHMKFFLIDAKKNDIPVFIGRVPTFLIFTADVWQYPLTFDKPHPTLGDLSKMLDQRKALIKAFKGDGEFAEDFDADL